MLAEYPAFNVYLVNGRLATLGPYAVAWGQGRRMNEMCGAVASVQIKKLPTILGNMRGSKHRIKAAIEGTAGLGFRKLQDVDGDTGSFLSLSLGHSWARH